jgi:hypothetical protein
LEEELIPPHKFPRHSFEVVFTSPDPLSSIAINTEVVDHTVSHERGNSSVAEWEKESHEDEEAFKEQDTSPLLRVYIDMVEMEELPSEAMDGSLGLDQKQPFVQPA